MIKFAYAGILRVYLEDGNMEYEEMDSAHVASCVQSEIQCDIDLILDDLDLPKVEGMYHLWFTGTVCYHRDYFGEWDSNSDITSGPDWTKMDENDLPDDFQSFIQLI